jgi:hypothetical protein
MVLAGSILIATVAIAQPSELEPFETWSAKRPNWTNDVSDVSYFAMRCGALYGTVSAVFKSSPQPSNEDLVRADDMTTRSLQLTLFAFQLGSTAGWTEERMKERLTYLYETYARTISANRTQHNNMFHGFIEPDWGFCIRYEKQLRAEANAILKR